jgi:hypothetical protein
MLGCGLDAEPSREQGSALPGSSTTRGLGDLPDCSASLSWWNTKWPLRRCLTLDAMATSADLVDFPALILLEADPALAEHAREDGGDLTFTLTDGTRLSHELEAFDGTTGALVAWVRIPLLPSAANTRLHLYFGNPAAVDQQDAANVWDPGHVAVWHLSQDPSSPPPQVRDSTRPER